MGSGGGSSRYALSFTAYSTLSGTFSGAIRNAAGTRSYPFIFTLPASPAWTKIIVTIPGDTGGTWVLAGNVAEVWFWGLIWVQDRTFGLRRTLGRLVIISAQTVRLALSEPTARVFTFTGVKLEIGTVATPFNRQSLAKSMADCQRYFNAMKNVYVNVNISTAGYSSGMTLTMPTMRASPTVTPANMSNTNSGGPNIQMPQPGSFNVYVTAVAGGIAQSFGDYLLSAEL